MAADVAENICRMSEVLAEEERRRQSATISFRLLGHHHQDRDKTNKIVVRRHDVQTLCVQLYVESAASPFLTLYKNRGCGWERSVKEAVLDLSMGGLVAEMPSDDETVKLVAHFEGSGVTYRFSKTQLLVREANNTPMANWLDAACFL